jgi:hypothetical protein
MEAPGLKQPAKLLLLAAATIMVSGCGKSTATSVTPPPATLTSGNWLIVETGTSTPMGGVGTPYNNTLRGALATSSGALTGVFATGNNQTLQNLSGSLSGGMVTLSSAPDFLGQIYNIDATIQVNSTLIGTYNLEDGFNGETSTGTVYATNVPSLSGNWAGTMPAVAPYDATGVAATIVQSATASPSSVTNFPTTAYVFPLSGTVTLTNSTCFSSGSFALTIDPTASYINGDQVTLTAIYSPGEVGFTWTGTVLNPNLATTLVNGSYYISGPHCNSITGFSTTLTTP